MDFHVGDPVIHWTYGIGEIVRMEEKNLPGQATLYYVVQARDLTVWVPVDGEVTNRLRPPTPQAKFEKLFAILRSPGEALPSDRLERRTRLFDAQKDGHAEANCRIIRDLTCYQQANSLNDNDRLVLKRAMDSLLGEWHYSMSVSLADAEQELWRLLNHQPGKVAA
jgi:RNA polymerase-interacting CarD/CdnL/TRCF family regulator